MLGLPAIASHTVAIRWGYSVPVYVLTANIMQASYKSPGPLIWFPVMLALAETFVFWILGAWIFSRVDVAVAVESGRRVLAMRAATAGKKHSEGFSQNLPRCSRPPSLTAPNSPRR